MTNDKKFPLWFSILTGLFVISNLFIFGIFSLIHPYLPFPDAGEAAKFPIQFFAIRHIALAVPLLHGLIRKDVKILRVMYTIFTVMSVLDVLLLGFNGYYIPVLSRIPFIGNLSTMGSVLVGILVFWVPLGLSMKYLRSQEE